MRANRKPEGPLSLWERDRVRADRNRLRLLIFRALWSVPSPRPSPEGRGRLLALVRRAHRAAGSSVSGPIVTVVARVSGYFAKTAIRSSAVRRATAARSTSVGRYSRR